MTILLATFCVVQLSADQQAKRRDGTLCRPVLNTLLGSAMRCPPSRCEFITVSRVVAASLCWRVWANQFINGEIEVPHFAELAEIDDLQLQKTLALALPFQRTVSEGKVSYATELI